MIPAVIDRSSTRPPEARAVACAARRGLVEAAGTAARDAGRAARRGAGRHRRFRDRRRRGDTQRALRRGDPRSPPAPGHRVRRPARGRAARQRAHPRSSCSRTTICRNTAAWRSRWACGTFSTRRASTSACRASSKSCATTAPDASGGDVVVLEQDVRTAAAARRSACRRQAGSGSSTGRPDSSRGAACWRCRESRPRSTCGPARCPCHRPGSAAPGPHRRGRPPARPRSPRNDARCWSAIPARRGTRRSTRRPSGGAPRPDTARRSASRRARRTAPAPT